MKDAPTVETKVESTRTLRAAVLLRPSRLQDPLLDAPVKTTPIPIYF
jgi:hypothetical protein